MFPEYVTLRSNLIMPIKGLTEGKEYEIIGNIGDCFIVLDDYGDSSKVHCSHFNPEISSYPNAEQSIFTHPKWVTTKETCSEINLIGGV